MDIIKYSKIPFYFLHILFIFSTVFLPFYNLDFLFLQSITIITWQVLSKMPLLNVFTKHYTLNHYAHFCTNIMKFIRKVIMQKHFVEVKQSTY